MLIKTLLVGSFSHPPAGLLLQNIPGGVELILQPEPENPYDSGAIRVLIASDNIPASRDQELELLLPGAGLTLSELRCEPQWMLGHVAANGGKPLSKAGLTQGNLEIGAMLQDGACKARLFFWPDGKPGIEVRSEEPKDGPYPAGRDQYGSLE